MALATPPALVGLETAALSEEQLRRLREKPTQVGEDGSIRKDARSEILNRLVRERNPKGEIRAVVIGSGAIGWFAVVRSNDNRQCEDQRRGRG